MHESDCKQLAKCDKDLIKSLRIEQLEHVTLQHAPTFVASVLGQVIAGSVFCVNNSYVVKTASGLYFVSGPVEQTLFQFLEQCMNETGRFTLFVSDPSWQQVLEWHKMLRKVTRDAYTLDSTRYEALLRSEPRYRITPITAAIIAQSEEFNANYYAEYWGSVEQFLAAGSGFCMVDNGQVICEATAIFQSATVSEIDIFTAEAYRGEGLAKQLAMAFIDHCLEQQRTPHWDCDSDNTASMNLAKKLGFQQPRQYNVYVR